MDRSLVKILALDDEPFILKLHTRMLADLGFVSCHAFETAREALDDLETGRSPDLIFLDLSMPEMDGIEFIRHLVRRGFVGHLVLVSGEDERILLSAERLVEAHGIAMLGHLAKPMAKAPLAAMMDQWERRTSWIQRPTGRVYDASEIEAGLSEGQFVNHYQPKVSVRTGAITGAECLSRWQHPTDGLVPPALFIPIAERAGLIDTLTRTQFRQALSDIKHLEDEGLALQVSVNLAASILASLDFADFAAQEAQAASVRPQNVVLEVTESQLIQDRRVPLDVLTRLKLMRFGLSIDDFGTGYSSLSQLRDIPFDELKIDQSFVHRATKDPTARAIYDASLGLAKQLNMKTVAEGVEDRADWDLVQSTRCDEAQGFFVARPMAASALRDFREGWHARAATEFAFP